MQYTNLGRTGLKVSRICLGFMSYGTSKWRDWVLDEEDTRPFVKRALELGINYFDTADMYSQGVSEEVLGNIIADYAPRDEVVIATKVFHPTGDSINQRGLSRVHIMDAIDNSLRRLKMDYVDLYQIHRWDPTTPIEETVEALHDVVKAGKARYVGASSMYAWQFAKALFTADLHGWTRFVTMQNHWNLVYREEEREMVPLCLDQEIGLIPWSPLARGLLTGTRTRSGEEKTVRARVDNYSKQLYTGGTDYDVAERCMELVERRGVPSSQIALAWLLSKPGVVAPIIGATKMPHLEEAVGALDVTLSDEEIASLEEPYIPHTIRGHR